MMGCNINPSSTPWQKKIIMKDLNGDMVENKNPRR
jgi:hypothetical protein